VRSWGPLPARPPRPAHRLALRAQRLPDRGAKAASVTPDLTHNIGQIQSAARAGSPDHDYYRQAAERLGANRACLSVARKLLKRGYHTLRELGEEALQPA
jgi:hypothetical protein